MAKEMLLNGEWQLAWVEGMPLGSTDPLIGASVTGHPMLKARVPAPIHQVLQEAGILEDPNIGMNSLKARWVEEQFWVYRHSFRVPREAVSRHAWLTFDRLEYEATVHLNGECIGTHANAHRPASFCVTGKLRANDNLLVVVINTGMHSLSEKSATDFDRSEISRLVKRHWMRKPQYQSGWDWNARLVNVGIIGDVKLAWCPGPRLQQLSVVATPTADLSAADVRIRFVVENTTGKDARLTLNAAIRETGQCPKTVVTCPKGVSVQDLNARIDSPRLWWPRGQGEQALYHVEATMTSGKDHQSMTRGFGIRRVEVDQSPHPDVGRYFILKINNRPVFCKGGNWAPADLLYGSVTRERYRKLVSLATEAGFNTLRVWGGGPFAAQDLCDACDEAGIMIWHDFLFACSKYPGDDPGFLNEIRQETTWAVRDMAHHPCLVVWCGNNEVEWGDWDWGYGTFGQTFPHHALFHREIPIIVQAENPAVFYWPSSPFSPDHKKPNDPTVGDQHPWTVSIGQSAADWWLYRTLKDRFPNEGGMLGASTEATLRQFLPESERHLLSATWRHHDNPFAWMPAKAGDLSRTMETVRFWTGRDPLKMKWNDYAFASAILQAEGLQEYAANYRRRMFSSASAIFWSYNDSWPVTHGWTIVDYYGRRKISYHPVRRAFQPVTAFVVEDGSSVEVYGVNDTPKTWRGRLRCGLFHLAGGFPVDKAIDVSLPANESVKLASWSRREWESAGANATGAFALLEDQGGVVSQQRLFIRRFKDLKFAAPKIHLKLDRNVLTATSPVFTWGVCMDVDGELPLADNCFDLLPGIPYRLAWPRACGKPAVVRCGSRDLV